MSIHTCFWSTIGLNRSDHYLPTVILIITGIPPPTHSFTLGLNLSFSANPLYRSLSFFSFRIHYMDFPDCLLLLLSISVFLLLFFFSVFTLFSCRFRAVDWADSCWLSSARYNSISYRISYQRLWNSWFQLGIKSPVWQVEVTEEISQTWITIVK